MRSAAELTDVFVADKRDRDITVSLLLFLNVHICYGNRLPHKHDTVQLDGLFTNRCYFV